MPTPTLSLCLIVRDETDRLERCLVSAAGLADEIVVADTGSRDGTPDLARRLGARVLELIWCDDFAAARNACADAATGQWILFLDADEQLQPCDHTAVRSLLRSDAAPGYTVEIVSPRGDERIETAHVLRLFRHRAEFRFEGRIHESVLPSISRWLGREPWSPPRSGLRLLHDGYRPEIRAARGKDERNRRLLLQAINDAPDEPGPRFLYARECTPQIDGDLVDTQDARDVLALLAPAADQLSHQPARGISDPALSLASRLALHCGDPPRATRWREAWHARCGPTARWCYAAGEASLLHAPQAARHALAAAATAPEGCDAIPTEPEVRGAWAAARIAATWLLQGDERQSKTSLASATRGESRLIEAIALARRSEQVAALPALLLLVRESPHDPRGWWALWRALTKTGENEKAAAMLATALRSAPGWCVGAGQRPSGLLSLWPT